MKDSLILSRPNFFPGQLIDYKDFNRLASQADRVSSLLNKHLFEGGGIIVNALDEFSVSPLKGLSCLVKPGIALLPTGMPLVLSEETVVDLSKHLPSKKDKLIVISLRNSLKGKDRYVDEQDGSITGYRTEAFEAEVVVGGEAPDEDGVELLRVRLAPNTQIVRLPEVSEEWKEEMGPGVIDLRQRKRIVPQTYSPVLGSELLQMRKALYGIEQAHWKMCRIYLLEDPFNTIHYLVQLHAELLSKPFQPLKVAFLIAEFAEKMNQFLERLGRHVGSSRSNFDRETLLQTVSLLEPMKSKEMIPKSPPLKTLMQVAQNCLKIVDFAEQKFNLLNTVGEALKDLTHRLLPFDDKIVLGGHLFERVDLVGIDNGSQYELFSKSSLTRMVSTKFENGDSLSLKGKFFKEGGIVVKLEVSNPEKPVVLLAHQYVRRAGSVVHYEMNGKHLESEDLSNTTLSNKWVNRGIVVSPELLSSQGNQLKIRIEKSDLDFGFFDIAVYQPAVFDGMKP